MTLVRFDPAELEQTGGMLRDAAAVLADAARETSHVASACCAPAILQSWLDVETAGVGSELSVLSDEMQGEAAELANRGAAASAEATLPQVMSSGVAGTTDPGDPNVAIAWDPNNPGTVVAWGANDPEAAAVQEAARRLEQLKANQPIVAAPSTVTIGGSAFDSFGHVVVGPGFLGPDSIAIGGSAFDSLGHVVVGPGFLGPDSIAIGGSMFDSLGHVVVGPGFLGPDSIAIGGSTFDLDHPVVIDPRVGGLGNALSEIWLRDGNQRSS